MPSSFKNVSNFCESVDELCEPGTVKIFVGNKCDLDNTRKVKMQNLTDKAEEHGVELYFETSAFPEYKATIDALFNAVIRKVADMKDGKRGVKLRA